MRGWGDDGWWIGGPQRSFRRMNPLKCVAEWSPFDRTVIHLQVNNGKGRGTPIYLPNRPKGGGRRRGGGKQKSIHPNRNTETPQFFFPFLFFFSLDEFSRRNSSRNEPSIDTLFYCLTFVKSLYRLVIIKLFLMKFSFGLDFHNCLKCSQQQWRERERETSLRPFIQTYISITGKEGVVIFGRGGEKVPIMDGSGGEFAWLVANVYNNLWRSFRAIAPAPKKKKKIGFESDGTPFH